MNSEVFLVGFFCLCVSRVYGAADGWVDLGGITVPTDECIFDGDGNSYIFTCNSDGNMTSNYYNGDGACGSTPITTAVSGLEYECDPVGFVTTDVLLSNPFTGDSCAISYATTAIATGICHYSNLYDAYVIYTCDGTPSITVEAFLDSSCGTSAGSLSYTSCYLIGSILYDSGVGIVNVSVYAEPTACIATPNATETTTSTPLTTKQVTTTKTATEAATTKTVTEMATTNSNIMTTAADATTTRMATTKLTTRLATEMTTTKTATTKFATTASDLADGWVDLGGITVPTDECIFDGDGNSYIFLCDSGGNMTSNYYDGDDDCSDTPITTAVSGLEYECDPVGYVTTEIKISNPFTGDPCALSYVNTAIATGVCHYSDFANAYVMYTCDSRPSIGVEAFLDSSCSTSVGSSSYTSCYPLGTTLYSGYNVSVYADPIMCYGGSSGPTSTIITMTTESATETTDGTGGTEARTTSRMAVSASTSTTGSASETATVTTTVATTEGDSISDDTSMSSTKEDDSSANESSIKKISFSSVLLALVAAMMSLM